MIEEMLIHSRKYGTVGVRYRLDMIDSGVYRLDSIEPELWSGEFPLTLDADDPDLIRGVLNQLSAPRDTVRIIDVCDYQVYPRILEDHNEKTVEAV